MTRYKINKLWKNKIKRGNETFIYSISKILDFNL